MFPFFYDPTWILVLPALAFAMWAQFKVKSTFNKDSSVYARRGFTAAQAARAILDANGLGEVHVEHVSGSLSDHYDPRARVLRLSDSVYAGRSVAAIGVAAHEAGHAIQHSRRYLPLLLRSSFVPVANLGSTLAFPLFFIGILFSFPLLMNLGIWFFTAALAFTVITLPVEFDASARALRILRADGMLSGEEWRDARRVLSAAALTYVAAAAMAASELIRLLILRNMREE
ncbi:MAG TPA: zinc metallopeptidase [Limnochordia bacterium]|nr:zinc metallopeptidase [Limnochordia bacterium]